MGAILEHQINDTGIQTYLLKSIFDRSRQNNYESLEKDNSEAEDLQKSNLSMYDKHSIKLSNIIKKIDMYTHDTL